VLQVGSIVAEKVKLFPEWLHMDELQFLFANLLKKIATAGAVLLLVTSETSVNFYPRRYNREDRQLHTRRRENPKSHLQVNSLFFLSRNVSLDNPTPSQLNPDHTITHFNIIILSVPRYPKWLLTFKFSEFNFVFPLISISGLLTVYERKQIKRQVSSLSLLEFLRVLGVKTHQFLTWAHNM
jgi:hypothetical protein